MHYGTFFRDAITSVVGYHEIALEAGGAFHSTKASGLNFRKLPGASGTAFSKISKNRATAQGIPKFSKFFSRKFSFHSTLLPENLEFSVECLPIRKFNSFRNSGNFSGKFLYDLPPFPNFGKFWFNGKRPGSKFDTTLSQSLARPQMAILNGICDFILRGTGPLKTTMDVIDAAKVIRLSMLRLENSFRDDQRCVKFIH